ncbi:MAG TPA: hypothetical protein VJ717_21025 [Gemmatimonadaceae bacterium]|nr:hypothetical protein [Gemmatimonadaceae bacterium]
MPSESDAGDALDELRELPREVAPDAKVQDRVIGALRAEGLLRPPAVRRSVIPWLLAAGVAVVAFGLGTIVGSSSGEAASDATFALMLYGGRTGSDSLEHAQRAAEYRQWAGATHATGRVIGGEALGDSVRAFGAPVQASGDLVGYFLIIAPDRAAAVRLASGCPHIRYGGTVVVREVLPT